MKITKIRHSRREPEDFSLFRPLGYPQWSFVHFISGATVRIDDKKETVPPHTCLIYAPGTVQEFGASEGPLLYDGFHFTHASLKWFLEAGIPVDRPFYPKQSHFITDKIFEMELEFFAERPFYGEILTRKAEELFFLLARTLQTEPPEQVSPTVALRLKDLRQRVFSDLQHRWTVEEMADIACCSPSRFHTVYRAYYGASPIDDLIRCRIDAAKEKLTFTQTPIGEISCGLGYETPFHFCRQFKKHVGLSPTQYRSYTANSDGKK